MSFGMANEVEVGIRQRGGVALGKARPARTIALVAIGSELCSRDSKVRPSQFSGC